MDNPSTQQTESQTNSGALSADNAAAATQAQTANKNAEAQARVTAIAANARKQALELFRQSTGVAAPERPAEAAAAPPVASQTPSPQPSDALHAAVKEELAAVQAAKTEAAAIKAQADARLAQVQAEERRWAELAQNPQKFLEAQNINLDTWQARLLNGGEPTQEELAAKALDSRVKAAEDRAARAESTFHNFIQEQAKTTAVNTLAPVLEKEFPLVHAMLGPDAALMSLVSESKRTGVALDAAKYFTDLESKYFNQHKQLVNNQNVNNKYKLSVQSSQAEVVAQSPQTLTNRVTSTVAPSQSRAMTDAERIARGRQKLKELISTSR